MTILGRGDLAPRRRPRRLGRLLAVLVVLALIAAAGYVGYVHFIRDSSSSVATKPVAAHCPKHHGSPAFAAPHTLRVQILNASLQTGLAAQVRSSLRRRGFRVAKIGNAMRVGHDVATVRYSPDQKFGSVTLAAQVPGATTRQVAGNGVLILDLGLKFARLRPAAPAIAIARRTAAGLTPTPGPTASASPSC